MSNAVKWIPEHGIFFPISADFKVYPSPGPGIFNLVMDPNPMSQRLGLQKVGDKFDFPFKIYDLGVDDFIEKIKKTWNSEYFVKKKQNLGIIFNGIKGTGKTISAKILCNEIDIPVIIINDFMPGMIEFVQMLEFECVILLDEAEKVFRNDKAEASQALLKMIDGVMNKSRKLYLLTTNTLNINENLIGRPGRIKYIKSFGNITAKAINQYVDDNLEIPQAREDVMTLVNSLEISTIDTLKAIVDEANIHGGICDENCLNVPVSTQYISILYYEIKDSDDLETAERQFKDAKAYIKKYARMDKLVSWTYGKWDRKTDPDFDWYGENPYTPENEEGDVKIRPVKPSGDKALTIGVTNNNYAFKGSDCKDDEADKATGEVKKEEETTHYIDDYLASKFHIYTDTIKVKGTRIKVGTTTENFGTVFKEDKDGWLYTRYGNAERRILIGETRKKNGLYKGDLIY